MASSVELSVKLPADLARDASEFNLLTDEMIAQLIREAVDERVNQIVNAEIHAYRDEKRAKPTLSQ